MKRVYTFGDGKAEGNAEMRNLLGGKGANLAEMNLLGMPVPPGFTITTEVCNEYTLNGRESVVKLIQEEVEAAIAHVETLTGKKFNDPANPLLVSVRSGARASMPGMMDTVLNLGMNDATVASLAEKSGNPRFAWDSYRRFVQMYGDVVLGMKPKSKADIDPFEEIMDKVKAEKGVKLDTELDVEDLQNLVKLFKAAVKDFTGKDFPDSAWEQLWGGICAVFDSWMNERAILYRRMNQIPEEWGTAVNVQAMVYGNMGDNSATGVAFSRDAATGENIFNGEYLINAQGEDVVAGIRTPQQITVEGSRRWAALQGITEEERVEKYPSLEESMPVCAAELIAIANRLENYYKDMQDMEFTIQDGKLWMLQTRNGKRTGAAMVKIAMDLLRAGEIDEKTTLLRMEPQKLDELLHPVFDKAALKRANVVAKGLPASPGAAAGQIVFSAEEAEAWSEKKKKVVLVRIETSPEDLRGMAVAQGILTMRGGMTSHAAVVARGMGKCCVSGAGEIKVDYKAKTVEMGGKVYNEGDWISLNGSTGEVYDGQVPTAEPELGGDFGAIMNLAAKYTKTLVRTNADTPRDAKQARHFGAQGIGLCRTEHMFFEGDRIKAVREMILASDVEGRRHALDKLLPMQRSDFEGIFEAMDGFGVTIRLLDPPLHEFVPHQTATQKELANEMGLTLEEVKAKVDSLEEFNPMLGHRGCRLGITYPEITEMQTRAIIEAALNMKARGIKVFPEIMIPLVGTLKEIQNQADVINITASKVFEERGESVAYKVGTMIEVPRAALTADQIATVADFFSFGTNDLTQMTFGYSRDDAPKFLKFYKEHGIIKTDPFEVLDQEGVGQLVRMGVEKGRATKPELKVGICGEHGGEPSSVKFCAKLGMNYVSCSPYRVPIARVAAAQAAIED
ncbi:pyruvate, phosphate dikinase [Muribaculum intestinale]|uniref:Pyruvate, phosphate dikinase n=3 Tax=Muribaculum intestinale TaxID=1796646 RepID=A0A4S1ZQI8_9BACT|nr:pyruvate, phosphate dikinase [Muribaculum intestinale]ROT02609.1 pyruvate, phosphate dikinase [Muribaculaceae bacterium Isolate-100 (HZI)]RXE63783.1 pyruvate, phosphate dikinase [Muribaculaceae bacterium Isolate-007 (NCI)]MYM12624.1 pyruvate, phosphate dikinase [Muribaculum intestinale]TGX86451.1 pyruvate, phosphate dikinase [Muribaculum intestinale]TGY73797.1 pyruvate, phosphate dikinase [Muribaculum intestinale]